MKKFYLFSLLFSLFIIIFTMQLVGDIMLFIDLPSIFLVFILSLLLVRGVYSFSEMYGYFSLALKNNSNDMNRLKESINFFNTLQSILIAMGLFTFVLGVICLFGLVKDPDAIGPGLSVALITVLYSIGTILVVVIPFRAGLKRMLNKVS